MPTCGPLSRRRACSHVIRVCGSARSTASPAPANVSSTVNDRNGVLEGWIDAKAAACSSYSQDSITPSFHYSVEFRGWCFSGAWGLGFGASAAAYPAMKHNSHTNLFLTLALFLSLASA